MGSNSYKWLLFEKKDEYIFGKHYFFLQIIFDSIKEIAIAIPIFHKKINPKISATIPKNLGVNSCKR